MSNYRNVTPEEITFAWVISQLDCAPSYEGMQDYVVTVHWRYTASFETYFTDIYGAQSYSEVAGPDFIPYADLTEDVVIGWLESSLDVPQMQAGLAQSIEDLVNPPIIVLPLPWAEPEEPAEPIVNI
jgi:hypothetical protein